MNSLHPNPWLVVFRPNPRARLRLLCLPHAGGNPTFFHRWSDQLPASVEVCALQLPGRGARLREAPFMHLPDLIEALVPALLPVLDRPFALFGHSIGALVSFELARALRRRGAPEPVHLFVSAGRAPQTRSAQPPTYNLPEPEFLARLRRLNGTPRECLENRELMDLLLPLLRADFALLDTYSYTPEPPLACPITGFGGLQDTIERPALEAWKRQTVADFALRMLPGDHFYLVAHEALLVACLAHDLQSR